ncbi:MAG TPA: hypothetical protein VF743_12840, partial [Acidimicrobiales bacterium]
MPDPGPGVERAAVAFARVLRRAGLGVPTGATVAFARALAAVGVDRPDRAYWAGRATLVHRPDDVPAYDRAFTAFFGGAGRPAVAPVRSLELHVDDQDTPAEPDAGGEDEDDDGDRPADEVLAVRWSRTEVLRHKDLAACT